MHSYAFLCSLMIASAAIADAAFQTDWSLGPGEYGPVTEWNGSFWESTDIDWSSQPGFLVPTFSYIERSIEEELYHAAFVHAEDIDDDGDFDVLCSAWTIDQVIWWENADGVGLSWTKHIIAPAYTGTSCVYAEDIDGDGDMDVLASADEGNEIAWWKNLDGSGLSWEKNSIDASFGGAHFVYSEDIDNDGDPDVLGAAYGDDEITWWENVGGWGDSWNRHTITGSFGQASGVFADDVNGDGYMDVLGAARSDNEITWWENSGTAPGSSWIEHVIDDSFSGAIYVYTDDMDGDGDPDVLGAALYGNEVAWWENLDGTGTDWTKHVVGSGYYGAHSVVTSDLDEDGDLDLATAAFNDGIFSWWENIDGLSTVWEEHVLNGDLVFARSVHCTDLDADGVDEIIGAAAGAGVVRYWKTQVAADGSLESSVFDTCTEPSWDYIEWVSVTPPGTSVSFQLRSSDDYTEMGNWSDTLTQPCMLEDILSDGDRYIQYRTILLSSDPEACPVLSSVTVNWDPLGVGGDPVATEFQLLGITPNPSHGSVNVDFAVPEPSMVEFQMFDITGRKIAHSIEQEFVTGVHSIRIEELAAGIYFCRMVSGEFTAATRFVVVE